ncbi:putative transposase of IS4/5 family DUF4096 [Micromonospora kangleipakensis]|uniref:Putative transposase of IS4/5 family DUF4096 n=1 Tax=Micromonospora kangleipakensis TaxID=1077942 RepID=A0A4Q8BFR6_9ACTN|nr:transposase [Micromonospora kangleipakensis]RZU76029.1 putative transposase of IS4/5 family DUF4096 [Micromonospora kangleipakensis]
MREKEIVDGLWERLAPLIPARSRRFRYPGRLARDDRAALAGILFVARTGIPWQKLPITVFGVSGSTCWRRLASGRSGEYGSAYTRCCWQSCVRPGRLTWPTRWSTPPTYGR